MQEPRDQRIYTGTVHIQVRDYPQQGEAILFLHYGGANLMMWQDVVPFFMEKYHVILIDMRGHGKSDKPYQEYHLDQIADDIQSVLQQMGVLQAHIVGSSLGAEAGLNLAARYPQTVASLVCEGALYSEYGPYGLWEGSEESFQDHVNQILEKRKHAPETVFASLDDLVDQTQAFFDEPGWWNSTFESVTRYDAIPIGDGRYVKSWGRMAESYNQHYHFYRFEDYYRKLQCPVMMMPDTNPGQTDREKEVMLALSALVTNCKIVAVPEWVHPFGWMITPESASRAVLEFLEETRS